MTITATKAVSATATRRAVETTAKQLPITNKIGTLVCFRVPVQENLNHF